MWADHADVISIQYSGTGALKTDFTRTGKRTYNGMLRDLKNSLQRYYKNNLRDGIRQASRQCRFLVKILFIYLFFFLSNDLQSYTSIL